MWQSGIPGNHQGHAKVEQLHLQSTKAQSGTNHHALSLKVLYFVLSTTLVMVLEKDQVARQCIGCTKVKQLHIQSSEAWPETNHHALSFMVLNVVFTTSLSMVLEKARQMDMSWQKLQSGRILNSTGRNSNWKFFQVKLGRNSNCILVQFQLSFCLKLFI